MVEICQGRCRLVFTVLSTQLSPGTAWIWDQWATFLSQVWTNLEEVTGTECGTHGPKELLAISLRVVFVVPVQIYDNRGPILSTFMSIHFKRHLFVFMSSWLPFAVFLHTCQPSLLACLLRPHCLLTPWGSPPTSGSTCGCVSRVSARAWAPQADSEPGLASGDGARHWVAWHPLRSLTCLCPPL